MKKILTLILIAGFSFSCQKDFEAPIPKLTWNLFESPDAVYLDNTSVTSMEGVYVVSEGSDVFGSQVVVKSSFLVEGNDTSFHVSIFCENDITWFICEGKSLDSTILLNGYWRKMVNVETGLSRFTINYSTGARQLLRAHPIIAKDSIIIEGVYGEGESVPDKKFILKYDRPLNRNGFQILAHRAGGRTSDHLNVSENSIEMIKKSEQFGSTGVEIDVRLTSDGVPILYHDNTVNTRLIQSNGMTGAIENYSYTQLTALARLINGEKIPTLKDALDIIIYSTNLEYAWLDIKYSGDLEIIRQIQAEYLQKAATAGRTIEILLGLPADDQLNEFKKLTDYTSIPSLCELTLDDVRTVNAKVWAPRWTLGTQNAEVDAVHAEGRKAFTWTMDIPEYIKDFTVHGKFDGILSNYPSIVAYHIYVR